MKSGQNRNLVLTAFFVLQLYNKRGQEPYLTLWFSLFYLYCECFLTNYAVFSTFFVSIFSNHLFYLVSAQLAHYQ